MLLIVIEKGKEGYRERGFIPFDTEDEEMKLLKSIAETYNARIERGEERVKLVDDFRLHAGAFIRAHSLGYNLLRRIYVAISNKEIKAFIFVYDKVRT